MDFICISLMISDVLRIFLGIYYSCVFFGEMSIHVLYAFLNEIVCFVEF